MTEFPSTDDRPLLATTGYGGRMQLWEAMSGSPVGRPTHAHRFPGRAATALFDSGGRVRLATADYSGSVRLWCLPDSTNPTVRELLTISPSRVLAMAAIHRPGKRGLLATIGYDDIVRIWDPGVESFSEPSDLDFDDMSPMLFERFVLSLFEDAGKCGCCGEPGSRVRPDADSSGYRRSYGSPGQAHLKGRW